MEQGVVGEEHVDQGAGSLEFGEFLHAPDMGGALRVQVLLGGFPEHERERHLREQHGLQVRLGLDRIGQPRVDLAAARFGDDVAPAVRAVAGLGRAGDDLPVSRQPAKRRVHLAERQLFPAPEKRIVVALEVITVARCPFEQPGKVSGTLMATL